MVLDSSAYNQGLDDALKKASDFGGKLKGILDGASKIAGGAILGATAAVVGFGTAAFMAAARVDELRAVNAVLAKTAGLSDGKVTEIAASIRKQGIESAVAEEAVAQFIRANLDLEKASDLARVSQDAAVISGLNSTETFNNITLGIVKLNTEILRTSGITLDSNTAFSTYAATIGKTAGALTSAEKQQAFLNAILKAGEPIAGAYAASMKEAGKVLRSFPRYFNDIFVAVGETIKPIFSEAVLAIGEFLKSLGEAVSLGGELRPALERVAKAMQPLITAFVNWIKGIDFKVVASYIESFASIIEKNLPGIIFAFELLGNIIGLVFKGISMLPAPLRDAIVQWGVMSVVMLALIPTILKTFDAFMLLQKAFVGIKAYGVAGGLIGPAMAPAITGTGLAAGASSTGFFALAAGIWAAILPLLLFIAAAALVAAAVYLLYAVFSTNFMGITDTAKILATQLIYYFQYLGTVLQAIWGIMVFAWNDTWRIIRETLAAAWETIKKVMVIMATPFVAWWNILVKIGNFIRSVFVTAINWLTMAVNWLITSIRTLGDAFKSLKIPDWLTPGSPTPFEVGLRGINDAMKSVASQGLPDMTQGVRFAAVGGMSDLPVMGGSGAAGSGSQTVNLIVDGKMIASERKRVIASSKNAAMQAFAQAIKPR